MKKIAVFPGSFDPFTKGHEDIVLRSIKIFDELIIGIGKNTNKQRYFELETMVKKIEFAFSKHPQVKVMSYEGLTADFAKKTNANFLVRGLRNTTDFEYENSIAEANKFLWKDLETVFFITDPAFSYISSSIIRDIHKHGRDVNSFLPYTL